MGRQLAREVMGAMFWAAGLVLVAKGVDAVVRHVHHHRMLEHELGEINDRLWHFERRVFPPVEEKGSP